MLDKQWTWVDIVKPPKEQRLPDILTRAETHRLLESIHQLRYRVYFVLLYSTGLRLNEGLRLAVGDVDADRLRIHVRGGKGRKDRYVPITQALLKMLRQWWREHRNPPANLSQPGGWPRADASYLPGDAYRRCAGRDAGNGSRLWHPTANYRP